MQLVYHSLLGDPFLSLGVIETLQNTTSEVSFLAKAAWIVASSPDDASLIHSPNVWFHKTESCAAFL